MSRDRSGANRYTWGSRALTLGLTFRIGKTDLKSRAREGVSAPTI